MGANAQGKYTIKGNLQNAEGQKIYLYSGDMGNMDIDSTIIANGKFTLNGELDTPSSAVISSWATLKIISMPILANCTGTYYHHNYR